MNNYSPQTFVNFSSKLDIFAFKNSLKTDPSIHLPAAKSNQFYGIMQLRFYLRQKWYFYATKKLSDTKKIKFIVDAVTDGREFICNVYIASLLIAKKFFMGVIANPHRADY